MKSYLKILLLILLGNVAFAQSNQNKRIELSFDEVNTIKVSPFKDQKVFLLVYNDDEGSTKNEKKYVYEVYDVNFKKLDTKSLMIDEDFILIRTFRNEDADYRVYFDKKGKEMIFYKYSIDSRKIETTKVFCDKAYYKSMHYEMIAENNIMFYCTEDKQSFQLNRLDLTTGKNTTTELKNGDKTLIYKDILLSTSTTGEKELHLRFNKKEGRREFLVVFFMFDLNGNQLNNGGLVLPHIDEETQRKETNLMKLSDGSYMALGTYSKDKSDMTNGIYAAKINSSGKVAFDKTFNYIEIPKFTSYLSEKQQDKIQNKKAKKEAKGDELNIDYHSTLHDIIEKDGKYYLIAEFYYPTYRTETYYNGKTTTTRRVFDGYYYTHGLISCLDGNGKMLWSNIFDLNPNYKPFSVIHFIVAGLEGGNLQLLMENGNYIDSKVFSLDGKVLSQEKSEPISTMSENDIKIKTYSSTAVYWYDKNFIVYGSQKIKNEDKDKRKVFFVNSLNFK